MRVLVVEDEAVLRQQLATALTASGYAVDLYGGTIALDDSPLGACARS